MPIFVRWIEAAYMQQLNFIYSAMLVPWQGWSPWVFAAHALQYTLGCWEFCFAPTWKCCHDGSVLCRLTSTAGSCGTSAFRFLVFLGVDLEAVAVEGSWSASPSLNACSLPAGLYSVYPPVGSIPYCGYGMPWSIKAQKSIRRMTTFLCVLARLWGIRFLSKQALFVVYFCS